MKAWLRQPLSFGMWLATCLVIGLMLAVFTILWTSAAVDSHDAKTAAARQTEGRSIAIDVLCGFGNGVADAGRNVIRGRRANGDKIPGVDFTKKEQKVRDAAADDYGGFIVETVQRQAGVRGRDVIKRDGTLNCPRLRVAAKATHP